MYDLTRADDGIRGEGVFLLDGDIQEASRWISAARTLLWQVQDFTMDDGLDLHTRTYRLSDRVTARLFSVGGVNRVIITAVPAPDEPPELELDPWGPWDGGVIFEVDFPVRKTLAGNMWGRAIAAAVTELGYWFLGAYVDDAAGNFDWGWTEIARGNYDNILLSDAPATNTYIVGVATTPEDDNWSQPYIKSIQVPLDFIEEGEPFHDPGAITPPFHGSMLVGVQFAFSVNSAVASEGLSLTSYFLDTEFGDGDPDESYEQRRGGTMMIMDSSGTTYVAFVYWTNQDETSSETSFAAYWKDGVKKIMASGNNDTENIRYNHARIAQMTDDDETLCFVYQNDWISGSPWYYQVSTNGGASWTTADTIDYLTGPPSRFDDGTFNFGNRYFVGGPDFFLLIIRGMAVWTTVANDPDSWVTEEEGGAFPLFPFEEIGFSEWASAFEGTNGVLSESGRKLCVWKSIQAGGGYLSLIRISNIDGVINLTREETFQYYGNPDYADPPGTKSNGDHCYWADNGIVYVGAGFRDTSLPIEGATGYYRFYRRERAALP